MRRLRLLLYIIFGVGLALFVVATAIFNLTKVRVDSAIVSAEIVTLRAPASGNIKDVFCVDGESVTEGTTLVPLENPKLEKEIIEANHDYEKQKLMLDSGEKTLRAKMQAFQGRKESLKRKRDTAKESMELRLKDKQSQESRLANKVKASKSGRLARVALGDQEDKTLTAKIAYLDARSTFEELDANIVALEQGLVFEEGKGLIFQDFEGQLEHLAQLRAADEKKRNALLSINSSLTVKAPATGKILKVLARRNSWVKEGDPLIRLEEDGPMFVKVILTRDQFNNVKADSSASVYLPARNRRFDAKVADIDFGTEALDLRETFQMVAEGNVVVTLAFTNEIPEMASGLPATVTFNKGLSKGGAPGAATKSTLASKGL